MTGAAALLRLDRPTWERFAATTTLGSAVLIAIGAFALFAWDRLGFLAIISPRPTARILLVGFYGWLGMSFAGWLLARVATGRRPAFADVFRLYGLAHLPLFFVALAMQLFGVLLQILGPARLVALFALGLWMPGQIVAANRQLLDLDVRSAVVFTALPYAAWLISVGWVLFTQVGHLL